jgi:hypothetical protein
MTFNPNKIIFGRHRQPADYRDHRLIDYITPAKRAAALTITEQEWTVNRLLDQGATPHCVGYAWAHFGISTPVIQDWFSIQAENLYYLCKVIDGEPGRENGTYTRSGVQAFMQIGAKLKDSVYAWAGNVSEVVTWVLTTGPVVTGTSWFSGMYSPVNGLVKVGGDYVGGHEWVINGANTVSQLFKCTNSWGTDFGIGGQFYISFSDYAYLLANGGDACTTAEVSAAPEPTPVPSGHRYALTEDGAEIWSKTL